MKKIIALALTLSMVTAVLVGNGIAVEAGCSGWTEVSSCTNCDLTDRCGFLWLNDGTQYKSGIKERYCNKEGKQVRETTYFSEKDGCCN